MIMITAANPATSVIEVGAPAAATDSADSICVSEFAVSSSDHCSPRVAANMAT